MLAFFVIKKTGLKTTPARLSIFSLFKKNSKPLSAEEIYEKLKKTSLDMTTIYRTLESFKEAGILKQVDLRKESLFYELTETHHHHHIVCKKCGDIEDFNVSNEKNIFKKALKESKKFIEIMDHSLELFGICKLCIKK